MATTKVTVDTSHLEGDTRRLAAGIASGAKRESFFQATRTAAKTRGFTPVRTGALLSTVGTADVPGGTGVTYGSGARYHYVQNARQKIVKKGSRGSRTEWFRTLQALAGREVGKV